MELNQMLKISYVRELIGCTEAKQIVFRSDKSPITNENAVER